MGSQFQTGAWVTPHCLTQPLSQLSVMKLQTQENVRLQNEIRKLEKILPVVDNSQKENVDVDEILSLTISYIGLLHNQLVGRVRTHGETYLRSKLGNNPSGINEKSSKDEIIKYLHKMLQK